MSTSETEINSGKNDTGLLARFIDTSKPYDIEGIPLKLYVLIAVLSVAILQLDLLTQAGVAGAYAVMWTIALLFYAIGERVRILKALVGGGLVVAWAGAALISRAGLIGQEDIQFIQAQMIGNGFLYVVLAALVSSSVLGVQTYELKKSLLSYAPIVIGGLIVAAIAGLVAGLLVGMPFAEVITRYFLPIMGGGAGAGALPMSEVYADVTSGNAAEYFNHAIGVLTLGNLTAILIASLLVYVAKVFPAISGEGKLVRGLELVNESKAASASVVEETVASEETNTHSAIVLVVCILLAGMLLAHYNSLHFFAWVTIISVILNLTDVVKPAMKASLKILSAWGMKAFLAAILVAFGLAADFDVIIALFSFGNLLVIVSIVVGAALGAGLTSHFVRLYPIEGAITGGLCMADAGGSGDLQVLSAARRIELYPYSQLSSRVGGAFVLILASYLFQFLS